MILNTYIKENTHNRTRNSLTEKVKTKQKVYVLQCDNCNSVYEKDSKNFKKSTINICKDCNHHKYAQIESTKSKRLNRYDASSGKILGTFKL
tara:strand:- start:179 stop:454 length:276 start_codon:yes stop_codon:yes gene_type:complete